MNTINWSNLASAFRHYGANSHVSTGKFAIGNESQNESRNAISVRPVRDKFTLSHEGQLAYAKHISQLHKEQSVPAAQTQTTEVVDSNEESSSVPVLQGDLDVNNLDSNNQTPDQAARTPIAESQNENSPSSASTGVDPLDNKEPVSDLEATNHTPAGAQDEGLPVANTSANSKIKDIWTLDENGNRRATSGNSLTPEARQQMEWSSAIFRWGEANDFDYNSTPTTAEEKSTTMKWC